MSHFQEEFLRTGMTGGGCYSCGQGLAVGAALTSGETAGSRKLELCPDCARMLRDELSRVFGEPSRSSAVS